LNEQIRLRLDRLQWLDADGEVVALDESSLMYLGANESGSLMWRALADGATRAQLTAQLVEVYGIDEKTARADVEAFLGDLGRRGLLAE
jgi:hypothetical protein